MARGIEFAVERAVFVATLHQLFVSGSDRDCSSWMADYDIAGVDGLDLHHFYRAMAWLGEELEEKPAGALAPRCVKDVIEERLFDQRRDLFTDLSAVFMDTTSLSFYGEGGETLGEHGYSKDYRPDLKQMILGLVVDGSGSPLCTEMWPGNTADVTTLLPVIDRLRQRFGIGRVCVVADRGMISAATIVGLEERRLEYILGARERSDALVRKIVLANEGPFVPLLIERQRGETQLFAKEVTVEGKRYIVCRNEAEAEKDRNDREAIVTALEAQLKRGDKALVGNSAYRRYLRKTADGPAFAIDAGKLAEEARFDGVFVLRTNAKITPFEADHGLLDALDQRRSRHERSSCASLIGEPATDGVQTRRSHGAAVRGAVQSRYYRGRAVSARAGALSPSPRRMALAGCVLASSMAFVDGSALTVALPRLRAALEADLASVQWVIHGYVLTLLADLIGARAMLIAGAAGSSLAYVWIVFGQTPLEKEMHRRGIKANFRATGQTGIRCDQFQ